ncbi:MAG: hypothetical protein ACJA16_001713 [Akkermansiaceae bacterium]|jgi:hypothetical protein
MVEAFTAHFTCRAARRVLLSNRQDIIPLIYAKPFWNDL